MSLTARRLREVIEYSPETGLFRWRARVAQRTFAGDPAGHRHKDGYLQIKFMKKAYLLHRLAWLYVYGRWPREQIDHINLDRSDNRIANLREANNRQQAGNSRVRRNNKCGFKGVYFHKRDRRWRAQIRMGAKNKFLGNFATPEDARDAYSRAAREYFGEFANVGRR